MRDFKEQVISNKLLASIAFSNYLSFHANVFYFLFAFHFVLKCDI